MAKRPTTEQLVAAVTAAGAEPSEAAAAAASIDKMLAASPDANAFLSEFNNKIAQRWNDVHGDETIYDAFKKEASAPTLQAVAYEKIAPVNFDFATDISKLGADEGTETRKIPKIHSILKSINIAQRFKTTTSQIEVDKIQDGQAISVDDIIANLSASYADARTGNFKTLVDTMITSNKTSDEINAMASLDNIADFVQKVKYYDFKFHEMRTDAYNAFALSTDSTAKADTKMYPGQRAVCFIDPQKLFAIEGDYYATLFRLEQAVPNVDFVIVDGMTNNRFAALCDPRVVEWSVYYREIRAEQIRGRESGEMNVYLFAKEIMGAWDCFNRVIFKTAA